MLGVQSHGTGRDGATLSCPPTCHLYGCANSMKSTGRPASAAMAQYMQQMQTVLGMMAF